MARARVTRGMAAFAGLVLGAGVLATGATPATAARQITPEAAINEAAITTGDLSPATLSTSTVRQITAEADWIRLAQDAEGAIATAPDRLHVRPYLANFAAIGLATATAQTGNVRYVDAAWAWLRWYRTHMDRRGFVTDYDRVGTRLVSTGDMDSTDAYAGTYLMALRAAHRAAPARSRLAQERPGIAAAVRAIEATQDVDGLTWAKPAWRVKYLMDQAETYAGLRAAADLARTVGDTTLAARADADALRLVRGVARLWNPATGSYDWAVHADGARQRTNWRVLYPDAMQQAWAVAFGTTGTARSTTIMTNLARFQPNWDRPTATARYDSGTRPVGYWVPAAWAHLRLGQTARADLAVSRISAAAVASNRAWPYTPSDAGQVAVALAGRRALP